jgi:alpha-glucosidase
VEGYFVNMSKGMNAAKNGFLKHGIYMLTTLLVFSSFPVFSQSLEHPIVQRISNGVQISSGSTIFDVQMVEKNVVRLYARFNGEYSPRTLVLDPDYRPPSVVHISQRQENYVISASGATASVSLGASPAVTIFDRTGHSVLKILDVLRYAQTHELVMTHSRDDIFYGLHGIGLHDMKEGLTRNTGGPVLAGIQGDSGGPFIFTTHYGLLVDSETGDFQITPQRVVFSHGSRPDLEAFITIGPPLQTMANISRLVGPPPLPPKWTLGFLNSQWGSTQSEVENIVDTYRKHKIPIDGFILDFDWKAWGEDNYGEWRWNSTSNPGNVAPDKFPDGASGVFAEGLRQKGVKLVGILKPRILLTVVNSTTQPTLASAYASRYHLWYPDEPPMPDYFSGRMARDLDFNLAQTRTWYWQHLLPSFQAGMAGWWDDEADISGNTIFNNFQFLNMGRMLYTGQRADSDMRVWSINRAFFLGASRYGYTGWSGDINTGFASMAFQCKRMLAAMDIGEFHWSMDTGGFNGHPSPENYARWMEFAAFVPIMRVHGTLNEKRQPWVYGPVAEAAATHAIEIRYSLLPYIYSYERQGTEGGVGLIRPLFWQYPEDKQAAMQNSEWMFGDALLVSPVVKRGATQKHVYLPAGMWIDYATGRRYKGHQIICIPIDATTWKDIPLFIHNGSIIATEAVEQYVGEKPVSQITLDVFPSAKKANFLVYDDDGKTYNYEHDGYFRQSVSAIRNNNTTIITLDNPSGSYASLLRSYILRIHVRAHRVLLNGKELQRTNSLLLKDDSSWILAKDKYGPVVLIKASVSGPKRSIILQ